MGFLGKINPFNIRHGLVKTASKNKALNKILPVALAFVPGVGPALSAAYSGLSTYSQGGNIKDALLSAGTSYAGSKIGSAVGGKVFPQTIGQTLAAKNTLGPYSFGNLGSGTANAIGANIANTSIGAILGGFAGNKIAQDFVRPDVPTTRDIGELPSSLNEPEPFQPKREEQADTPGSLTGFGSFSPEQLTSNIATQGVYGGGSGPQEEGYFINQINRRLIDDSGRTDKDLSEINPIESSYLAQLGLGGFGNPRDLLEAISGRRRSAIPA